MAFQITEAGIFRDVPVEDYFRDPCPQPSLTQSIAKVLIERSPAHAAAAHPRLTVPDEADDDAPEKYDASKAIGNAAHALLIGRGKEIAIGEYFNWQTKLAKEFRADAIERGREPILAKHYAKAEKLVEATKRQIGAVAKDNPNEGWDEALTVGGGEVVIAWQEDGLWFRSLVDWMASTTNLIDVKTTALSCAPHELPRLMLNGGWALQAAFQRRGLDVLDPENAGRRSFKFIAIENTPPFALTAVEIPEAALTMGAKRVQFAVDAWKRSMESGEWPAYGASVHHPTEPEWSQARWLEREVVAFEKGRLPSLMGG